MKSPVLHLTTALLFTALATGCAGGDPTGNNLHTGSGGHDTLGTGGDGTVGTGGSGSDLTGTGGSSSDLGNPSSPDYTGDYAGMINQCVLACENFYSTCPDPNGIECTSFCEEWHLDYPTECMSLREAFMGCVAQHPSACKNSDWGYLLEDKCDGEPANVCRQAEGKDCALQDSLGYTQFCGESFAYICQEGRAPAECTSAQSDSNPALYCCDSGDLF